MVEGKGSKAFDKAKQFCLAYPDLAASLLDKITKVTIQYLKRQVDAGVDCVQVFDSWSGLLSYSDFKLFAEPYLLRISDELSTITPVILFPKGSWYALEGLSRSSASGLGIDWTVTPEHARTLTNNNITLQGNFDPNHLVMPIPALQQEVKQMIDAFGKDRYIVNLGHGILPNIPVDHAKAFIDAVKSYQS
jgi:uroporphyrinogen decarboxylase